MSSISVALDNIASYTAYRLAGTADCGTPENLKSPGAEFLTNVRDAVLEYFQGLDMDAQAEFTSSDATDAAHDIADNAVPIYTYVKWQTFIDLAAWQEEIEDLAGESSDMDNLSNIALFMIGERLALNLFSELIDLDDDDDDEDTSSDDDDAPGTPDHDHHDYKYGDGE